MATRDGIILDLCWLHVDMTHPRANDVVAWCQQELTEDIPEASVGVNTKLDQTEALIKVTALSEELAQLPGAVRNAIIRVYTEADYAEALAMVRSIAWTGELPVSP